MAMPNSIWPKTTWIAFAKDVRIAVGAPEKVAAQLKAFSEDHLDTPIILLDAHTSQPVEIDLRGSLAAILERLPDDSLPSEHPAESTHRAPGRPKLGVVAREVTLLPRHWEWLGRQPGGASVALRKLVEAAQRANRDVDSQREARDSAYRFMHAVAGDAAGFEEASRALFRGDLKKLGDLIASWPPDLRSHLWELARRAVPASSETSSSTMEMQTP
ncbi:hypothetical protein FHS83_003287 [Rhizomicrobium palustre]|uniref:DUF2239 family protein n=1 Tax=Rhizomicrobium palustre TaxID=189966 RepID=A0A846N380_9PROT|nr:DUF2239 family protein [Rhizomicrobium palustre]NIK89969.1 hypothetical protein [Rhizomicrobium palustre]